MLFLKQIVTLPINRPYFVRGKKTNVLFPEFDTSFKYKYKL